jgi:type IV pilus assembly protein PilX
MKAFSQQSQRGAALVVSLLLLLVMTILALSMSQTTRLQERMAGNSRDTKLAFQSAETGLRAAEDYLKGLSERPIWCNDPKNCVVVEQGIFDTVDLARQTDDWWKLNGQEFGTIADTHEIPEVKADPKYVIEYYGDSKGGLMTIGRGVEARKVFYKITARSRGSSEHSEAVNESVIAIPGT